VNAKDGRVLQVQQDVEGGNVGVTVLGGKTSEQWKVIYADELNTTV